MRILKVHNYYQLAGGEDTVFHNEVTLLRSHGHEVLEYLEFNKNVAAMSRLTVGLQTVWSVSSYRRIKRVLLDTRPDLVHFHNTFPLISPAAYYACDGLGIPVVQTLDNQRLMCPASSFYRDGKLCLDCLGRPLAWPGILHACYHDSRLHTAVVASMVAFHRLIGTWRAKVDAFLCSTRFYREMFVQAGLPAGKIVVVPHFVWPDALSDLPKKTGEYALFVGRLDPEKGVRTLLEAWRHLDFPLKIRGHGRMSDVAREYVRQHELRQIEFVGRLEQSELAQLIENARFLVVPSEGYYETFGMVIIEAYARGVPVIASNIGVIPEMVLDQQTGLLFEAGNALDLAEKVRWLCSHPDQGLSMGTRGFEMFKAHFTPEKCYSTLLETYQGVLNGD